MGQVSGPQGLREASQDFGQPFSPGRFRACHPHGFPLVLGWRLGPVGDITPFSSLYLVRLA